MKPITFSFTFDYSSFLKVVFNRFYNLGYIWLIYICAFFTISGALFNKNSGDKTSNNTDSILSITIVLIVILAIHLRVYLYARNIYKTTANAGEETFWTINETGIEKKTNSSLSQSAWTNIYKISDNKKWVFIYFNKLTFHCFPKSLISENDFVEIKKMFFASRNKLNK